MRRSSEQIFQEIEKTEELESAYHKWCRSKKDFLALKHLMQILASLIDKNVPLVLELRDACVEEA